MNTLRHLTVSRHTQHRPSEGDPLVDPLGITRTGVEEARILGKELSGVTKKPGHYVTYDSPRALSSTLLLIDPVNDLSNPEKDTRELLDRGVVNIDAHLDYIQPQEGEFADKLLASYLALRNFEFLVKESDHYDSSSNPISSYSRMAKTGADYILKSQEDEHSTHVVAREFIFVSTAAKLIGLTEGSGAEVDYSIWYSKSIEARDLGRTALTSITADNSQVVIKSNLYSVKAPVSCLTAIMESGHINGQ